MQYEDAFDNWYVDSFYSSNTLYKVCPGGDVTYKAENKYTDMLGYFTEQIPDDAIRLGSEVVGIEGNAEQVSLTLASEETIEADYAIFTPSAGVLKSAVSSGMFTPPLSDSKIESVDAIGYGTVDKILLMYDEVWWPNDAFWGFGFLYDEPSNYTESDAEADWTRSCLGLYAIINKPNVLLLWVTGAGARKAETLTDEQVMADAVALINKFLGNDYPNIPPPSDIRVLTCALSMYSFGLVKLFPYSGYSMGLQPPHSRIILVQHTGVRGLGVEPRLVGTGDEWPPAICRGSNPPALFFRRPRGHRDRLQGGREDYPKLKIINELTLSRLFVCLGI